MADTANATGPVVFAYDGSEQSKAAIQEGARQLSNGRDAIVLTVWEPLTALPFVAQVDAATGVEEGIEIEARRVADEGARLAASAGFDATAVTVLGTPVWQGIVATADERDASIVVMGSHGRTGIGLVLMGSVASAVARHTERPVLIVHAASDDDGG